MLSIVTIAPLVILLYTVLMHTCNGNDEIKIVHIFTACMFINVYSDLPSSPYISLKHQETVNNVYLYLRGFMSPVSDVSGRHVTPAPSLTMGLLWPDEGETRACHEYTSSDVTQGVTLSR